MEYRSLQELPAQVVAENIGQRVPTKGLLEQGHQDSQDSQGAQGQGKTSIAGSIRCDSYYDSGIGSIASIGLNSYRTDSLTVNSIGLDSISNTPGLICTSIPLSESNRFNSLDSDSGLRSKLGDMHISECEVNQSKNECSDLKQDIPADIDITDEGCYSFDERCNSGEHEVIPEYFHPDDDGDNHLHLSIVHRYQDIAASLIKRASSWRLLNLQNHLGQTALHLAVLTDQPELVRKLAVWGAIVDIRDRHGNTALHMACRSGAHRCVAALTRPITHWEIKEVLYDVPFQHIPQTQDIQNYNGETCLQLAASGSYLHIMDHLIKQCGADINSADWKSGRTMLHRAVEARKTELVEFLLRHPRIDIETKTYEGYTALQLAQGRRYMDIVQLLMCAGAEPSPGSDDEEEVEEDCDEEMTAPVIASEDVTDGFDDLEIGGEAVAFR